MYAIRFLFNVRNFHDGLNYDYDFIMEELSNAFKGKFECFEEDTENYRNFFVTIEKEIAKIAKIVMKTF